MKSKQKPQKTRWHRLLGRLFKELLVPKGVLVYTEVSVMGYPPKADILLLRKKHARWTKEQRSCLPDGIRDSRATHILIEFKYTESVNKNALIQTLCYDYLYKGGQELREHDVRIFLASSKTPRASTLKKFDWHPTDKPGVYKTRNPLAESVTLILLNELADKPHNAWIKCFASRKREKKFAFEILMNKGFSSLSSRLQWFLEGLLHFLFTMGGEDMDIEITPDDVMKIGKKWQKAALAGIAPKERLAGITVKERLAGLELKDILSEFSAKEIEACLKKLRKKQRK